MEVIDDVLTCVGRHSRRDSSQMTFKLLRILYVIFNSKMKLMAINVDVGVYF